MHQGPSSVLQNRGYCEHYTHPGPTAPSPLCHGDLTSSQTHPSLSVTFLAALLHLSFSDLCVRSLERLWFIHVESQHVNWAGSCILWCMSFLSDLDASLSTTQATPHRTMRDIMRAVSEAGCLVTCWSFCAVSQLLHVKRVRVSQSSPRLQQQPRLFSASVSTRTLLSLLREPLLPVSMHSSPAVLWILPGTERLQHRRGRRTRTLAVQPNGQEMDMIFTESIIVSSSGS